MACARKSRVRKSPPIPQDFYEMIDSALANGDDIILTIESDPESGSRRTLLFFGKYVSACMIRKLSGLAESQRDEGCRMAAGEWV